MLLTSDHEAVQEAVRAFVQSEVAPHAAAWDKSHEFPRAALQGLASLGCYGVAVPEQWGGAGLDCVSLALVLEEIAAGDGATSTIVSVSNSVVCSPILAYGTDAQKERYLRPLAQGKMLGAFCLTEPHAGSDASAIVTRAGRDGDHWVLNGVKQFITTGREADVAIVFAITDKAAGKKGISAFVVPTNTPGYVVARLEDKLGQRASDTAQIVFNDCRIPADHLLGAEGPLGRMLANRKLASLILWGPPGCGKTTIARLLAESVDLHFEPLSAVFSGVADLRKVFEAARQRRKDGRGTLLFVDEIHRFNRAQQDALLPYVEDGTVTLIGATTENPSFEVNAALLSRATVHVLRAMDEPAMNQLLDMGVDGLITDRPDLGAQVLRERGWSW